MLNVARLLVIAGAFVIAAVLVVMLLLGALSLFLFRGVPVIDSRPNAMTNGYSSSYDELAAAPATQASGLFS